MRLTMYKIYRKKKYTQYRNIKFYITYRNFKYDLLQTAVIILYIYNKNIRVYIYIYTNIFKNNIMFTFYFIDFGSYKNNIILFGRRDNTYTMFLHITQTRSIYAHNDSHMCTTAVHL